MLTCFLTSIHWSIISTFLNQLFINPFTQWFVTLLFWLRVCTCFTDRFLIWLSLCMFLQTSQSMGLAVSPCILFAYSSYYPFVFACSNSIYCFIYTYCLQLKCLSGEENAPLYGVSPTSLQFDTTWRRIVLPAVAWAHHDSQFAFLWIKQRSVALLAVRNAPYHLPSPRSFSSFVVVLKIGLKDVLTLFNIRGNCLLIWPVLLNFYYLRKGGYVSLVYLFVNRITYKVTSKFW